MNLQIDAVECKLLAHVLQMYIRRLRYVWDLHDKRVSELAWLQTQEARRLFNKGIIDEVERDRICSEIDNWCGDYDFKSLDRWELSGWLREIERKARRM